MEWKQASNVEGGVAIPERWIHLHYYEALNLLFRIENALRVFVYIVLKNELRDGWADAQVIGDDGEGTISSIAKKRMGQAQTFGYLGHPITCPVMHLNSGELTRLIVSDAYWPLFKPYFLGSKEIIHNKLDEVASIRNSLAHFRPIRVDDVDVIKQNSKHFLLGIEGFLKHVLNQGDVVPTNTAQDWYLNLKNLAAEHCTVDFHQSADGKWVRISVRYTCPTISKDATYDSWGTYTVLTLRSSAVLEKYPEVKKDISYLSESVVYPRMLDNREARFGKTVAFILSRSMLEAHYEDLHLSLEEMLNSITQETELIQQDHLARGALVHSAKVTASFVKDSNFWSWRYEQLETPVGEGDPSEYWGDLRFFGDDFLAGSDRYPWMPETVSKDDSLPF